MPSLRKRTKVRIRHLLQKVGLRIGNYGVITNALEEAEAHEGLTNYVQLLQRISPEAAIQLLPFLPSARSQLGQDLFVLSQLGVKRGGYFVEFGATNGVTKSNSFLLEKELGWSGILAEPARVWHRDIRANRAAVIETRCVWKDSSTVLEFSEADVAELSTVSAFSETDYQAESRRQGEKYGVATISLIDLLSQHGAPSHIDYLSVDTEGSEYDILAAFDFDRYSFGVITCEHNYTPTREKVHDLLTAKGYRRVLAELTEVDDFYVYDGLT